MTHIVHSIRTKKQLRDALEQNQRVYFEDPSVFQPRSVYSDQMNPGESLVCTNHPKRSWFAKVTFVNSAKGFKVQ